MSRLLAALVLFLARDATANNTHYGVFPESEQVFRQLQADPRRIQINASYYRLDGKNRSDLAIGHSWGMAQWHTHDDYWAWQWNVEGMAYSRFTIGGSLNSFETVDFFGNLPVSIRHRGFSARAMLFHESSHLGDDYIRRTNDQGFRYSIDGTRLVLSAEPFGGARLYMGVSYLLHTVPDPARKAVQLGVEFTSRTLTRSVKYPIRFFAAQDLQFKETTGYGGSSRTMAGLIVGFDGVPRSMRFYLGRFEGFSPYGQFYRQRERFTDIGISFHF